MISRHSKAHVPVKLLIPPCDNKFWRFCCRHRLRERKGCESRASTCVLGITFQLSRPELFRSSEEESFHSIFSDLLSRFLLLASTIKAFAGENTSNSLVPHLGLQTVLWIKSDKAFGLIMDSTYSKDFGEIPAQNRFRFPTSDSEDNLEDFCTGFTSSDESFSSNGSKSSSDTNKTETFDLSLRGSSTNESNHVAINAQKQNHKSLKSIARLWKNFRVQSDKSKQQQQAPRSILRKPTEYFFVKGMSGLPLRVVKTSSSSSQTSCHRCTVKNAAIS